MKSVLISMNTVPTTLAVELLNLRRLKSSVQHIKPIRFLKTL